MAGNSTDPGRSVTSKVTAILMAFADDGVHTLTEIACCANLPTSTAHRLASELVAWRLLERTEDRSYRIGLPLRMIASEYSESEVCTDTQTVISALPVLHELSRATRNEVRLGVLRGAEVLTVQLHANRTADRVHADGLTSRRHAGACDRGGQSSTRLLPACGRRPCHRRRLTCVHTAHHHLTRRLTPETLGHQIDADRHIAERIRVRQGGYRDAHLLPRWPRRCLHRASCTRSQPRVEAGRQRTESCVSQSLPATRHRVAPAPRPTRTRCGAAI